MFVIRISELEVYYRVGVPEEERATPQRLLISVEMNVAAEQAAVSDDVGDTVDYHAVSQRLLAFGEGKSWKLLERLTSEIAAMILASYSAVSVSVEVKKFILPEARYVAVSCQRSR